MATHLKNLSDYDPEQLPKVSNAKFGIVVSEWNSQVTHALAEGAIKTLSEQGVPEENIIIKHVPGSFELPLGAQQLIEYKNIDAVLCLGCVIQGETRHFEFICQSVSQQIGRLNLDYNTPVIFGVLTTDNFEQAMDRAGGKHGNKGVEAAVTAIKMIGLQNDLISNTL